MKTPATANKRNTTNFMSSASLLRLRIIAFCGVILLAVFFRFYRLDAVPPGLWYDEAINGLDALTVIHHGPQIFFTTEAHPREPLLVHIIAIFFLIFHVSTLTLRATSAFIGLLTIPLVYLFVQRANRNSMLALLSAFFLATLCWHFHFSRLSFRTILVPPIMLILFTFLLQAFQTNTPSARTRNISLAGITLGLGAYTYLAFRLVPIILIFLFIFLLLTRKMSLTECVRLALMLLLFAFIVFAPLLTDYIKNPEHFIGRAEEVSLFDKGMGYATKSVTNNLWKVALMFTFRGDHVAKHNLPFKPVFDPIMSFIFYLGIVAILYNAIRRKCIFSTTVMLWFLVMLLASVLSFGAPNLLRTLGA
ncbi:glycosyltransferase family 39 protein, partial [Candidatus Sumerlaeota bacterium]|nr:glycosyltransferase family 39 protein [Candidatus Sumerlaeota bacterium]